MKKTAIALVISFVAVVLVLAIILSTLNDNNHTGNPQTPTPTTKPITNVHISNFYFSNFFPAEGLSWNAAFVIEVTNNETVKADNLTLTFNSLSPYSMTNRTVGFYNNTVQYNQSYVDMGKPCLLEPLKPEEARVFYGYVLDDMSDYYKVRGYGFVATLKIGDVILDQATIEIP